MLQPFKILAEKIAFEIPNRHAIIETDLETPEGKKVRWTYITGKDIAVVLALDTENQVYLKQEWRLNRKDFVWEVVSGVVEETSPTEKQIEDTAYRELQEEIGMRAHKLKKLLTIIPTNHTRSKIHLFLATDLEVSKLPGDEHEILEVRKLPFAEAYDLVLNQQEPTAQNAAIFLLAKQLIGL